jgi:thioredoxin 1
MAPGEHTVTLTQATFFSTIEKDGIVVVDWWAGWCRPCRAFAPVFAKVAARHDDIVFGTVDTEAERALAWGFSIRSVPTLMIFRDSVPVVNQAGALPEGALEDLIARVRGLDMRKVRRRIAAAETSPPGSTGT